MAQVFPNVPATVDAPIGSKGFGFLFVKGLDRSVLIHGRNLHGAGFNPKILNTAQGLIIDYRQEPTGKYSVSLIREIDGVKSRSSKSDRHPSKKKTKSRKTSKRFNAGESCTGTLKSYYPDKGYGFINVEGRGDIFFHISQVRDNLVPFLKPGEMFSFKVCYDRIRRSLEAKLTQHLGTAAESV